MREHLLSPGEYSRTVVLTAAERIEGVLRFFETSGFGYPSKPADVRGFVNILHGNVRQIVRHAASSHIVDPNAKLSGLQKLVYETIGPLAPVDRVVVFPAAEPVRVANYKVSFGNEEYSPMNLTVATHGDNGMYMYYETWPDGVLLPVDQMTWRSKKTRPDLATYARASQRSDVPLGFTDFSNGYTATLDSAASGEDLQAWMKDFCFGLSDLARAALAAETF